MITEIPYVDKRLDMFLSISVPLRSYVLSSIPRDAYVPVNSYSREEAIYIDFFINKLSAKEKLMVEALNPVIMGEIAVISEKIDSPILRMSCENGNMVPTLSSMESYAYQKELILNFRFLSKDLNNINKLIR